MQGVGPQKSECFLDANHGREFNSIMKFLGGAYNHYDGSTVAQCQYCDDGSATFSHWLKDCKCFEKTVQNIRPRLDDKTLYFLDNDLESWHELVSDIPKLTGTCRNARLKSVHACIETVLLRKNELHAQLPTQCIDIDTLEPPFTKNLIGHTVSFNTGTTWLTSKVTDFKRLSRYHLLDIDNTLPESHQYKGRRKLQRYHDEGNLKIWNCSDEAFVDSHSLPSLRRALLKSSDKDNPTFHPEK